ncbi:MAG: hypothetical protein ACFFFB_21560 [Candidatus Heimdallarchaeota archaeon]
MELILNTVRRMENDQAKEYAFGDKTSLKDNLAITFLNPTDLGKINLGSKPHLKISSKFGEVIVKGLEHENVTQGTILMPNSIWSNQITGIENLELKYKNIIVNVVPTEEPITSFDTIIQKIKEG